MASSSSISITCGQLILGGYLGPEPPQTFLSELKAGRRAGAILFKRNLPNWEAGYAASIKLAESTAQPSPIVAVDQEGGRVQRFGSPVLQVPSMRRLGEAGDERLVWEVAHALGMQLLKLGFNTDFAPVLDVDTNPKNPVIGDRAFSREPEVVGRLGSAWVEGLQQAGVIACGKHFPGHGDTTVDSHLDLPTVDVSLERLRQVELVPFRAAIEAGVEAIMSAHIVVPSVCPRSPATLCSEIIRGWLRDEMGFKGVVFSDDLEMKAIADRYEIGEAAVQAIRAGCDILLICKTEAWQQEAHEALVREAEKSSEFLEVCQQAAQRSRSLRSRYPIPCLSQSEANPTLPDDLQRRLDQIR